MSVRFVGAPIVSQTTLTDFMARYLATAEGQETAKQFAAAGIQSYFIANPIENDIAERVAAYIAANPPANGQNATAAQVQQAVNAYYAANPDSVVTNAELASAVAAYLIANPPQPGATGPAGQNATAEQVAQAVAAYMAANPISAAVNASLAAYFAANPQQRLLSGTTAPMTIGNNGDWYVDTLREVLYGPKAAGAWPIAAYFDAKDVKSALVTNSSGVWTRTYPADFWAGTTAATAPSVNVNPTMAAGSGAYNWTVAKTYNATTRQWTITVTFTRIAPTVSILVLGTVNVVVAPGVVTFDYQAHEPNAA